MRNLLLLLFCVVFYRQTAAQCSMIPVPLSQRAAASVAVVEGKVISKISSWDSQGTMIYTTHTIEIYKVFKGNITNPTIELLTEGGIVGNQKISVSPSLELNVGDVGLFTCTNLSRIHPVLARSATPKFEAYASAQGFVRYDLATASAAEPFTSYNNIEYDLYPVLTGAFGRYREIKEFDSNANARLNPIVNTASITGFSPSTVTAGTETTITITGSGFGSSQGSGTVGFKNADDGGATYITPLASQYVSWTSTQIVVEVPDNAGTGTIQVTQGTTSTSASSLTVSYAHLNVEFDPGTGDEAYQTDHVNDNGSGGYTWRMNTAFAANTAANASFMRAFDTWRCGTGVDWTIGTTTSIDDAVSDGTNIICFDDAAPLSAGILGVCYSYWSGCASGPTIVWYVNELDIIFDDGSNISPLTWEFGTALPSGSEYDFETVAVHELGHGHQLGHVIAPGAIMHYAISNGAANRALGTDDLAGGNFVQAKSVVANVCGPGATSNYSCGNPPVAAFSGTPTTVCTGSTVTFTDLSTNSPTSWSWTFTGGTPSTSTLQNPIITYNTPGTHNVSLTATNGNGSDGQTTNNYITVNASPTNTGTVTSVTCNGGNNGAINITPSGGNSPYTFSWNPS
ncbi:MAG TPA: PKD domain-containing protein, partial [Bacteroidia bacterium]|nr:PKD domain-containing protein [Bacteroidia bacterium]